MLSAKSKLLYGRNISKCMFLAVRGGETPCFEIKWVSIIQKIRYKALSILSPKMANLGVDENMSQGLDGLLTVGYESSVFQEEVFAGKMSKKVKATESK